MESFVFQNSTRIIFGKDSEDRLSDELSNYKTKILLHYGQESIKKSGLYDKVTKALTDANIDWIELSGVVPNPRLLLVKMGIELCRREKVGLILAVGGGSVIDSAKAIAVGVPYAGDVWDFFTGKVHPEGALPVACILTIPAAGSETSGSSVITKEETLEKRGLTCDRFLRPVFAIMNPERTCTLSAYNTAVGAADILSHIMERYFTPSSSVDYSDRLCEASMVSLRHNLPRVLSSLTDYDSRAELMWTGTLAHSDLIGMGRIGDWASHGIEHELSALYDIPHGAGLAIIFPAWMKYVYKHDITRFAQWANRVWGVEANFENPELTAIEGIKRLEEFYEHCGLATRLSHAGIPDDKLEYMAAHACGNDAYTLGSFVKLNKNDILEILKIAR